VALPEARERRLSRTIEAASPGAGVRKIAFDYLVVATGMRPSYFGRDEFARYAPGLKSLSDAETIRAKILSAFELAATTEDEDERARQMTFVLVGAGPSGVELAASLAHLVKVTLRGNFRRIDPAKASIILLDAGKRVLPTFAESLSRRVSKRLKKLGVKVATDVKVEKVDEQGVIAGGTRIPSATVLWTAGVAASPIPKMLGTKTDRAGRALVDPFLKVVDARGVFVVGDAASMMQNEHPVPGVAQAAIQEGRYVGRLIAKELKGRKVTRPFRYFDKGNMAVVGKNYAVLERGSWRTGGFLTWLVWAFVHVLSLPQLQNRLRVQYRWLWSYFTGQRSSRLIPEPLDAGHGSKVTDVTAMAHDQRSTNCFVASWQKNGYRVYASGTACPSLSRSFRSTRIWESRLRSHLVVLAASAISYGTAAEVSGEENSQFAAPPAAFTLVPLAGGRRRHSSPFL
jgi:NADH:ubiquinone reductase (H+-translocating)